MTTPEGSAPGGSADDRFAPGAGRGVAGQRPAGPSMVPGICLLTAAAVLMVLVLIKPQMPGWLRGVIVAAVLLVVVALAVYSVRLLRMTKRGAGR